MRFVLYSGYTLLAGIVCALPAMLRWYVKTYTDAIGIYDRTMMTMFNSAVDAMQMVAMGMFVMVFYYLWYVLYPD